MKTLVRAACLVGAALIAPGMVAAQDVAITNARIIVGSGQVIDSGTIIVTRREDRLGHRRRGADARAAHHRREGHERDARLHRWP